MIRIIIEVAMVPVIIVLAALLAVAVPVGLYWTFLRVAGQHEADPTKADHMS
jgi:hypothetical protein